MSTKTSKIVKVELLQSWSKDGRTYFPHKVTFENGDIAIANKIKENAYRQGQQIEYKITGQDRNQNNIFKEVNNNHNRGGKKGSNAAFALSYAKDIMCKFVETHNVTDDKADKIADKALVIAEKFNVWLNQNS